MTTKTLTCSSCGFQPAITDKAPAYCIKCGHRYQTSTGLLNSTQRTLMEDSAALARSSESKISRRSDTTILPRSIDGFEVISLLGVGGMGAVYLAYEPLMDREVALKVLSRSNDDTSRSQSAARFLSEAVLTGRLFHAGIIPIYRVGFDKIVGYYYTMRFVSGHTLADTIHSISEKDPASTETYSIQRLLSIFVKVCEAVGYAHQNGIVHRDLKPSNVMLGSFGEVFVVDWGLAKESAAATKKNSAHSAEIMTKLAECRQRRGSTSQVFLARETRTASDGSSYLKQLQAMRPPNAPIGPVTEDSQILGTPGYLSPEQGSGVTDLTPASDVYSLGVMLYEMLTLQSPIVSHSTEELVVKTVLGQITPIKQCPAAANLPSAICDVVTRAMALNSQDRYANACEMAEEVSLFLEGKAPWKKVIECVLKDCANSPQWKLLEGLWEAQNDSLVLQPAARARCLQFSIGDFRCECSAWVPAGAKSWSASFFICEVINGKTIEPRYEIRLGVDGRPFIELHRNGVRVQRRFDIRLQAAQNYDVAFELEHGAISASVNGRKFIHYVDAFPQTGGAIEIGAGQSGIHFSAFKLITRGAPLNLSFMAFPDRLYRVGRYAEARELYRQLAISHPDREEGVMALYKAGRCSVTLKEMQVAFDEFTKLEGSMLDHCCALGLAHIGMEDGNIDWAWEALKNGYKRNHSLEVRAQLWFMLLSLIERLPEDRSSEKSERYWDLLKDLAPESHEASQLTFNLLESVQCAKGHEAARTEAIRLMKEFSDKPCILKEAIAVLGRAGISRDSIPAATSSLDQLLAQKHDDVGDKSHFHMLRAEIGLAEGNIDIASFNLREAFLECGYQNSTGTWAKSWQAFIHYLKQRYAPALADLHECIARTRRSGSAQVSFLHLLEGICYLAKQQAQQGNFVLRTCAEVENIWGIAAAHVLESKAPEILETAIHQYAPAHIQEAIFLAGEAHYRSEHWALADRFFKYCMQLPAAREMFIRLCRERIREIEVVSTDAE